MPECGQKQRHGVAGSYFRRKVRLICLYYTIATAEKQGNRDGFDEPGEVGQSNFIAIQELTIFHKYSILSIKDKSNRHSQSV
mgnify:CR=1 FL=1